MEQYCSDLYAIFKEVTEVYLIANTKWKLYLPIFWLIALIKWCMLAKKVDIIYIWDWSISFIWWILWKIFRKKVYITIHWLDITWKNRLYQALIPFFIKHHDRIVCVSSHTRDVCINKWIKPEKIIVINNWVNFDIMPEATLGKKEIFRKLGISNYEWKKVLVSIGRFIERKWIHIFLDKVLPDLESDKYIYLIWGYWKYESTYNRIIKERWLSNTYIIWKLDKNELANILSTADLFIMPNIYVEWDMEGFGIVLVEAGYYWIPVIASNIEWIQDAIIKNETGLLIDTPNVNNQQWINSIKYFNSNLTDIKGKVEKRYSIKNTKASYIWLIK